MNKFIFFVTIAILAVFLLVNHERKSAKNEVIIEKQEKEIEQQNQQLEKKDEIIETKNYQQKIISKTSANLDLATRSEWMQLIFEEKEAANN